ncbi:MAG: competence protein ComEC [Paracoccaceae bacterium]
MRIAPPSFGTPNNALNDLAETQRGALLLWMPFGLALGIGAYFSIKFEPSLSMYLKVLGVLVGLLIGQSMLTYWLKIPVLAVMLCAIGFLNAGLSAHRKAAPVLAYHYYGPIEGRIIGIDRSAKDKPRITLDHVRLKGRSPSRTPHKIRISLHYSRMFFQLEPGQMIATTASLSPPSGPVEPGGFDFQRFAWFRSLGAIGYSRNPVLRFAPSDQKGAKMGLMRVRMALATSIRSKIDGQAGAFAAAILTGDRSAINPKVLNRLRTSNLAHLLAISGLHMGLLTGFIFAVIRYGIALIPFLALRLPVKKIAAVGAFVVAVSYLFLSGGNVATQRAFVMVAVMLLAVMLDRRALTLRAVALAAVIVLIVRPESLIEAGFQMSFAATTALVAVFMALRDRGLFISSGGMFSAILRRVLALLLSSAIAGLATAPVSAFHFNQVAQYGLIANLLSVPAMGALVMPAAVVAILLSPFGIDGIAWLAMGAGIDWILFVASKIASFDGAVVQVIKPATFVLVLICGGALVLIVLRNRLRFLALVPIILGFWAWSETTRPALLLSSNGRLMGIMGTDGRALNRKKGTGFVASNWLENDGDGASQADAALRFHPTTIAAIDAISIGNQTIAYSWSKTLEPFEITDLCTQYALLILPQISANTTACPIIDKIALKRLGSVSITTENNVLKTQGARQFRGARLWSR